MESLKNQQILYMTMRFTREGLGVYKVGLIIICRAMCKTSELREFVVKTDEMQDRSSSSEKSNFPKLLSPFCEKKFFKFLFWNNLKQASIGKPSFLRLRTTFNMFFQWRLSLSGDIEINPGPLINFKYLTTLFKKKV